jgi:hypothetical protein
MCILSLFVNPPDEIKQGPIVRDMPCLVKVFQDAAIQNRLQSGAIIYQTIFLSADKWRQHESFGTSPVPFALFW